MPKIKKLKNEHSDKKQYAKYKQTLGKKNVPNTFESFQEMKYNGDEQWKNLRRHAKRSTIHFPGNYCWEIVEDDANGTLTNLFKKYGIGVT